MAIEPTDVIDVKSLTPFKKFIMTIGNIPTSYLESMSYAELLMWFCNYLQETVIPTVNNNAEAVEELQGLYEELRQYVNDYFDNLDVQYEINQKLDNMAQDGSLTNLIKNYVDPIYQAYEDEINAEVANIHAEVVSAVSGMPIPVTSTSSMTDTSKLYLNTTNGYWYYYDGDSWEQGGVYQATEIGDGAIDLLNLDSFLQPNFNMTFSENLDLGNATNGFTQISGDTVTFNTNSNYSYYEYDLQPNRIYEFNGAEYGNMCSLAVVDENDKLIYYTNHGYNDNDWHYPYLMFRVKKANCKAYISHQKANSTIYFVLNPKFRRLVDISNNLKINTNVTLIDTILDTYSTTTSGALRTAGGNSNYKLYIYSYEKGKTYHVSSYNMYSANGFSITNESGNVVYHSSTGSVSSPTFAEYTFTADTNGYIFISQYQTNPYVIEVKYQAIEINLDNKFKGLKIGADGDSISAGVSGNVSYVTQIANANNCTLQNLSVGGATIASNTYSGENARHWICTSVQNLADDCELIMLSGGVNDYWNKVPMGVITNDYTTTLDPTTFIGGLETMCRTVLDKFKTARIVFVTYHKINNIYYTYNSSTGERHTFKDYLDAIKLVMDKYSIPVIDINSKGRFNTALEDYKTYTDDSDGVHPTTQGYELFYNDIVINELNNLM